MSEHDTPDNGDHDPLVARLRRGLGALTDGVGDAPPELGLVTATPVPSAGGRRRWVTAGAAAAAVALVATGAVIIATREDEPDTQMANLDKYTQVAPTTTAPSSEKAGEGLHRAVATVLDDGRDGPQLCLGAIAESYPPQCGGLDITNWKWASELTFERASGVRWGEFIVVGTYDREAQTFTLTQAARDAQPGDYTQGPDVDFTTPCDEPAGGWPAATDQQLSDAAQRIQAEPAGDASDTAPPDRGGAIEGFGGLWIGHNPKVLNVRIVGDLTAADAFIREFFDGPLCLIPSERTLAELQRIQDEISLGSTPAVSGSYPDVQAGRVVLETIAPDAELEQQMAERYGDAVVVRVSGLVPIAPGEDPDPGPGTTPDTAGPAGPSTDPTDKTVPPVDYPVPIDPDTPVSSPVASHGFERLDIELIVADPEVRSGDYLRTRLRIRNRSGETVTDPGCVIASAPFALIPADEPAAELWRQPEVDCVGPFDMRDGYDETADGPTIPATTKFGDPLPPGEYLAAMQIEGYPQRLAVPVTVS